MNLSVYYAYDDTPELAHYGIRGMKWGLRRYQNPDGSLTSEGKARYASSSKAVRDLNRLSYESGRYTGDKLRASWKTAKYESKNPEKAKKWSVKKKEADEGKRQIEKYIQGILDYVNADKKTIRSISSAVQTERGYDFLKDAKTWLLGGALGAVISDIIDFGFPEQAGLGTGKPRFVPGKQYITQEQYDRNPQDKSSKYLTSIAERNLQAFKLRKNLR